MSATNDTLTLHVRAPADLAARLDRLAERIAPPGSRPSRAAAARATILAGLRELERLVAARDGAAR